MTNIEARRISYKDCPVRCVGCERDCENMIIGKCKANLIEAKINMKLKYFEEVTLRDLISSLLLLADINQIDKEIRSIGANTNNNYVFTFMDGDELEVPMFKER